jgi:hypothetical protein
MYSYISNCLSFHYFPCLGIWVKLLKKYAPPMAMTDVRNLEFDLAKQGCRNYINASPNLIYTHKTGYVNRIRLLLTATDTSQVHSLTLLAHVREHGKMKDVRRKYSRPHNKDDDLEIKSGIFGREVSLTY